MRLWSFKCNDGKEISNSKFYGFDNHEASIEAARQLTQKEGVADRAEFAVVSANESIDNDFELVTFSDCLHDMADLVDALKFAKQSLKKDGTCMIMEPIANDNIEDNFNLVNKIYYTASSIICVPNSLADNGIALGAQVGEKKKRWQKRQALQSLGVLLKHRLTLYMRQNQINFLLMDKIVVLLNM